MKAKIGKNNYNSSYIQEINFAFPVMTCYLTVCLSSECCILKALQSFQTFEISSWILNSAFVGEESVLERSVVLFNLLPLALSADCARLQNKLVLFWNTVCPLECHPFRSLRRAYEIAPDADSDVCSTMVLPIIVIKLSCLHWCFVRRTENSAGSRMYICDGWHLFSFLCFSKNRVSGQQIGSSVFVVVVLEERSLSRGYAVWSIYTGAWSMGRGQEADMRQKCRCDEKKTFEGSREDCPESAATQIHLIWNQAQKEGTAFKYMRAERNILYNSTLFLLFQRNTHSVFSSKNIWSSFSSNTSLLYHFKTCWSFLGTLSNERAYLFIISRGSTLLQRSGSLWLLSQQIEFLQSRKEYLFC